MKTITQQPNNKRTLYGWETGGSYCLSAMDAPRMVHGASYRPCKIFATKEDAEAEAASRDCQIEWDE